MKDEKDEREEERKIKGTAVLSMEADEAEVVRKGRRRRRRRRRRCRRRLLMWDRQREVGKGTVALVSKGRCKDFQRARRERGLKLVRH